MYIFIPRPTTKKTIEGNTLKNTINKSKWTQKMLMEAKRRQEN